MRFGEEAALLAMQLFVCVSLTLSAFLHFVNPYFFLESVLRYEIVPRFAAEYIATFLVFNTATLGLAVLFRAFQPTVFWWVSLLGVVFLSAQIYALAAGKTIACGCFGPSQQQVGVTSILLAVGLIISAVILGLQSSQNKNDIAA